MRKLYYMGKEYAGYTDNAVDMTEPKLNMTAYGTSSTAGSTITKSVITNNGDYQRVNGAYVTVTFANANTGSVSLNVDGTGSRAAYYNGSRLNGTNGNFAAGETVTFVYDGTYYQRVDANTDDTSILKSIVKLGWTDVLQNGQLLLKKLLSKLLNCDYVIETGVSGIWTYRKWASGIAECWGKLSGNIAPYYGPDGADRYGFTMSVNFPQGLFTSIKSKQYQARVGNGFAWAGPNIADNTYYAIAFGMPGTQFVEFNIYVIGVWKN